MNPKDIPKTVFITHRAVYVYVKLPFGLTSAGSTYQRAMKKIFKSQIGRNLECYVDDMISKSTTIPGYVEDLKQCFDNLRKNKLKLNPEKCTFGVGAGKFLGLMISNRGIEANPEKIKDIQEMKAPRTQKDVQKLAGSLAALRIFVSKLAERCLPFFDLLKGATNKKEVNWNPECQNAFEEIKYYLSQPPVLTKAQPREPIYLYLSAEAQAVGATLIREENGTQQPVYYVSQVLKDAEIRYPRLEKFAFALVTTSRKLRHYFQGREIRVVTNQPLRKIIHKPDISGRLVNWAVELSQFNLSFVPRTTIKAQALADFIIECNFPEEEPEPMDMDQEPKKDTSPGAWTLKVDGSSTSERSGAGLILKSPKGFKIQTTISFGFPATNNQAEYEIVVKQTNGEYIAKDPTLAKYQALVQSYLASIPSHQVLHICREENEEADILSKLVRNSSDLDCSVYFEELLKPSIESGEVLEIESIHNWMTPFIKYLENGELPEDKGKAQRLKAKAAKFFLEEGILYCKTFSSPILKCIGLEEAKYCLAEVHEGICGDHMSAKALAHKIIRQGYYWPTIHQDAIEFIKKCKECQLFSNVSRISPVLPSSVLSPIPFAVWGIDIMRPFPRAKGDLGYLLVSIDYMTKWVEAKAMRTINQQDCIKTSPRTSTGETPFKLAYGTEAMLPIEVGSPSHKTINFEEEANEKGLRTNMELIDEVRDQAVERMEKYKEKKREHFKTTSQDKAISLD
ncbi:uncharacterized protein LOC141685638 [Apium graveolens]|uniref:uncharacterized protein LOC141685638 n=1 Tax=Apium graveolens TaxID=4045 RepID=UPI003D794927